MYIYIENQAKLRLNVLSRAPKRYYFDPKLKPKPYPLALFLDTSLPTSAEKISLIVIVESRQTHYIHEILKFLESEELSRVSKDCFKALESKISLKKLRKYVDQIIMDMHQFEVSWISVVEPSKLFKDECLEENI